MKTETAIGALVSIAYEIVQCGQFLVRKVKNMRFNSRTTDRAHKYYVDRETSTDRYFDLDEKRLRSIDPDSRWTTVWKKRHKNGGISAIRVRTWILNTWHWFVDIFRKNPATEPYEIGKEAEDAYNGEKR